MGQQAGVTAFTVAGNLIGSYFGGPIGGAIGGLAGGLIGSLIFGRAKKPIIPDLNLMNSSYGNVIPLFWGKVLLSGTPIWMSAVQIKQHGVGKGVGGAGKGQSQPSLWQNAGIAFGESPGNLVKLFLDGKLFLDNTSAAREQITKHRFAIREYDGNETQLPDFLYSQWVSEQVTPGNAAPAYRGLCHLVFDKIDLANYGNRLPQTTAVWTNTPAYHTVFAKLQRFTPDIDGSTVWGGGLTGGLAVDWVRGTAYTLSAGGVIRSFDLSTHRCITVATYPHVTGIACGNGTNLYGWGGVGPGLSIYVFNPDSLAGAAVLVTGHEGHNVPGSCVVAAITTAEGTLEFLCGVWQLPFAGGAFYYDAQTNTLYSGTLPVESYFATGSACLGAQDPVSGGQDVWFINFEGDIPGIHVCKAVIPGGATPEHKFFIAESVVFWPADFGTAAPFTSGAIVYDPTENAVIIHDTGWTDVGANSIKWSETAGIIWTSNSTGGGGHVNSNTDRGFLGGLGGGANLLNIHDGTQDNSPIDLGSPTIHTLYPGQAYDSYAGSVVFHASDDEYYVAYLKRVGDESWPVGAIITDICLRVGLTSGDLDVSELTDTVVGYAIREHKSAGAAIADLCHVFQIDMIESDYKLKFVPRGQAAVATIPQADLGSIDTSDPSKYWMARRPQEPEMPLQITVKYSDPDLDYQPGSAGAQRTALPVPTVFSKRRMVVDLPITTINLTARQLAERWLYTMWAERDMYTTALTAKYLWLDPGDNLTVLMDNGDSYGTRIETQEIGTALGGHLTLSSEDATTYVPSTMPGALVGFVPQVLVPSPFGQTLLFNVPLLQDRDEIAGEMRAYFGAGSFAAAWAGGRLYQSADGAIWNEIAAVPAAVNWGYTTTTLGGTVAAFATDYENTVTIAFAAGDTIPVSCSYGEMMNGANAALLGSEIIQFRSIEVNADGTYVLSVLSRGQRGTEWAVGSHRQGEIFIMLEAGLVGATRLPLTQIGVVEQWRLLPTGRFLDQVSIVRFAYLGYDKKPYAPVGFTRAVSGSDLLVEWVRRTRIGGLLQDGVDTVPLNEDSEAYEAYLLADAAAIDTFDPTDALTYVRVYTGLATPQLLYTAAQMATDGFTMATDRLYLVVYQISAVVGRGFRGYQMLPPF